jgi:hypothetical protein
MHDIQAVGARLLGEPIGELGVWWVGPVAMARPGVRNQSMVVVPSLP